jgi:hypothetical protein
MDIGTTDSSTLKRQLRKETEFRFHKVTALTIFVRSPRPYFILKQRTASTNSVSLTKSCHYASFQNLKLSDTNVASISQGRASDTLLSITGNQKHNRTLR